MVDYQQLAADYARHRQLHPEVLRNLIQTADLTSASKVLEVGCGTGNYLGAISAALGCECFGIDPSEKMLATAKERSSGVTVRLGKAERLEFPAQSFNLVFSVDVIHHVQDRSAYFQEAHRVLRDGGLVCTVTDSAEMIRRRQPLAVYFPKTVEADLQRYPSIVELSRACAEAGFGQMTEAVVEFPFPITDIAAYRDKAYSCLHLIPPEAHHKGVARMEQDLALGPLEGNSRSFLHWAKKP